MHRSHDGETPGIGIPLSDRQAGTFEFRNIWMYTVVVQVNENILAYHHLGSRMQCGPGSMEPGHGYRIIQKECITIVSSLAKKSSSDDQENASITISICQLTGAGFGIGDRG